MQSNEGTYYFASAGDGVKLWDSSKLEVVKQYNFHNDNVKDLSWSKDNSFLCSTSASGDKIVICDCHPLAKDKPKVIAEHALEDHQTCVCVSVSGRKIYSGGVDGAICVWDRETGRMKKCYKDTHSHPITCVALNDSETHVASGSNRGEVVVRNLSNESMTRPDADAKASAIRSMAFSPWKHSLLGMTTDEGSIKLWDTLHGGVYHHFTTAHCAPAMSLTFSPVNELLLASVGLDKTLRVYDIKGRKFLSHCKADQPLMSLTFLYDGYSIFAGSSLGKIFHFDLRYFTKPVRDVVAHNSSVHRLAVQNRAKKKSSKSSRASKAEVRDAMGAGDEMSRTKEYNLPHNRVHGKGDYPPSISSNTTSSDVRSSSSDSVSRANAPSISNGHRGEGKDSKSSSTPTVKARQPLPSHVDDLGGVISPVREEGLPNYSATSADSNLSAFPDGGGLTFSNDTIGSYSDDILSPLNNPRGSRGRVTAGTQLHAKTSPHPLRQSYNASPADPKLTSSFRNRRDATSLAVHAAEGAKPPLSSAIDKPVSSVVNGGYDVVKPAVNDGYDVGSATSSLAEAQRKSMLQPSMYNQLSQLEPSTSSTASSTQRNDMTGFQFQAEYLRNTVKELVDEMGGDLRAQINDVMNLMVKLSLQQEAFMRRVVEERRCQVNEELLRECEMLREENERLKSRF